MKFCIHCGAKLNNKAEYCPKCGTKQVMSVHSKQATNNSVPVNAHRNKFLNFLFKYKILILVVLIVIACGGGFYKYYSTHTLPSNIANQTLTLHGSDGDSVKYHTHSKTFTFTPSDLPTEKYAVEHVSKTDDGHKATVQVQGLNRHSEASSFTFNDFHGELSAIPHGDY